MTPRCVNKRIFSVIVCAAALLCAFACTQADDAAAADIMQNGAVIAAVYDEGGKLSEVRTCRVSEAAR